MKLHDRDLHWLARRLPRVVVAMLEDNVGKAFVAGGFIRSVIAHEPVNDVDVFTPTADKAKALAYEMASKSPEWKVIATENAFTVVGGQLPVQFIHRWSFEKPEDCIASFDFTIASAAIWAVKNGERHWSLEGVCDQDYYADLAAKRLVYRSPVRNEEAGGSMLRLLKFYQRGYRAPLDTIGAVMARMMEGVSEPGLRSLMADHGLTGEQAMARLLSSLLREVDPDVDPMHHCH